jgi:hypothetical protein
MDEHSENVYNLLMRLCPETIKPFAEAFLPAAVVQMEEDKKLELEARLEELKDHPEKDNAEMLIAFAKSMGADPSMFANQMPELAEYF